MHYDFEPCAPPGLPGETCCVVRSGAAIKKGQEVCNAYNHLTPDLALVQYGFLLPEVEETAAAEGDGKKKAGGAGGGGAARKSGAALKL